MNTVCRMIVCNDNKDVISFLVESSSFQMGALFGSIAFSYKQTSVRITGLLYKNCFEFGN
jgi:hypothetical protein